MRAVFLFALSSFIYSCGAPPAKPPSITLAKGTATISIQLAGIRNSKGEASCALFNGPDGFPSDLQIIDGARYFKEPPTQVECKFTDLPAGKYAVSARHDENGNAKLDTNLVGAPTEGYGFTNNIYPGTRAATFDESMIVIGDGETKSFTINLKY